MAGYVSSVRLTWCITLMLVAATTRADAVVSNAPDDNLTSALAAYEQGNLDDAERWFALAHGQAPTARTWRGLGVVAYRRGEYSLAYARLTQSLASQVKPLTPSLRARVVALSEELRAKVATLVLRTVPETAVMLVDGHAPLLDSMGKVVLEPGRHLVGLAAAGHTDGEWTIEVGPGLDEERELVMAPVVMAPLPLETAEKDVQPVSEAVHPGSSTVLVPRGEKDDPPAPRRRSRAWAYGLLGAAAASFLTAGIATGIGMHRTRTLEAACRDLPDGKCSADAVHALEARARLDLLSGLAIGGAAVGAMGAATGTWLWVSARRADAGSVGSVTVGAGLTRTF